MGTGKTIAIGIGALVVGALGGYALGYKLTVNKLENWANDEIDKVRKLYREREGEILQAYRDEPDNAAAKTGVFATPEGAAAELIGTDPDQIALSKVGKARVNELFVQNGYAPLAGFEQSENDKVETGRSLQQIEAETGLNVLKGSEDDPLEGLTGEMIEKSIWDNTAATGEIVLPVDAPEVEEEDEGDVRVEFLPKRHPDRPYVIPESWYMAEDEYAKLTLTYYEEDDVLTDEQDLPVPAKNEIVGDENLHKFGIGTNDKNTVYVRSEKRKADYEVIRDRRSYTQVVHGEPPKRESKAPHKMRDDGD